MNKEEAKEIAKIVEAFAEGVEIEVLYAKNGNWESTKNPNL